MALAVIGMFGLFLFMTFYLQVILDYSPVMTGLAFLPLTAAIILLMDRGMGLIFMPVFATATAGVAPQDSGVTSATINTSQRVGGSFGTALLNTIATSSAAHLTDPAQRALVTKEGVVHGYTVAIWWAAAIMLLAGLVAALTVTAKPPEHGAPQGTRVPESVAWDTA